MPDSTMHCVAAYCSDGDFDLSGAEIPVSEQLIERLTRMACLAKAGDVFYVVDFADCEFHSKDPIFAYLEEDDDDAVRMSSTMVKVYADGDLIFFGYPKHTELTVETEMVSLTELEAVLRAYYKAAQEKEEVKTL